MQILYFAWVRERIGTGEESLTLPDGVNDVDALLGWLTERGEHYADALGKRDQIRVAVNQVYVQADHAVSDKDEIAIFPPRDRRLKMIVRVQTEDFDAASEIRALTGDRTDVGAVVTFTGLVRGNEGETLTLEHYAGMTEKELVAITEEAASRWSLQDLLVIHRFGALEPGEQIVLVATLAAHRRDAFEAAEFLMDWLKTKAPFWKKEETAGETRWVEARAEDEAATERWDKKD